jgi:hypothetical protein
MSKNYNFNKHFGVKDKTPEHLNVLMDSDIAVFIDPFLIGNNRTNPFANKIYQRSRQFLEKLNRDYVSTSDRINGITFLSDLTEANEYHLGYSSVNKGKGIGSIKAVHIYDSLHNNVSATPGLTLTNEADNVLLLVEGIGQDNMSDTLANVCRDLFAEFTYGQCIKYGISVSSTNIRYFDGVNRQWKSKKVKLPFYNGKTIILIPKFLAGGKREYQNRYNWFVASNNISADIINGKVAIDDNSNFIYKMKNGTEKAIVKNIYKQFRKPKGRLYEYVIEYPKSLIDFKEHAKYAYHCVRD